MPLSHSQVAGEGWGWDEKAPPCDDFKVTYNCISASTPGWQGRWDQCVLWMRLVIHNTMGNIYFLKVNSVNWWRMMACYQFWMWTGRAGRGLITNITTVHDKPAPALTVTLARARRLVLTISRVKSRVLALTQLSHLICCSLNMMSKFSAETEVYTGWSDQCQFLFWGSYLSSNVLIQRVKADTKSLCSLPIDQYQ